MSLFYKVRAFFRGPQSRPVPGVFERHTKTFLAARKFVRVYYAAFAIYCLLTIPGWGRLMAAPNFEPLWPVKWVPYVGAPLGWKVVFGFYLVSALAVAAVPHLRPVRFAAWLGFFQYAAMLNSFDKINRHLHVIVMTSFVLIFLPDIKPSTPNGESRSQRHAYLTILTGTQAFGLLAYSMAGLGKFYYFIRQAAMGEMHALSPNALATHVAHILIRKNQRLVCATWLIDHPYVGWPLMVGVIYLQFFSLWAAFRPSTQRIWGVMLLSFHIGNIFLMDITFWENILFTSLILIGSPFAMARRWSVGEMISSLPVIAELRKLFGGQRATP